MIKSYIKVSLQQEGFHKWENAPEEVAFLRNTHRHMFHIYATIEVKHDDRELEFILVKRRIEEFIKSIGLDSQNAVHVYSCEQIARLILAMLQRNYGISRYMKVEVYEDNENGGIIEYLP